MIPYFKLMKSIVYKIIPKGNSSIYFEEYKGNGLYPYFHKYVENQLIYIKKGKGSLFIEDSFHEFKPGDVIFIYSNLSHPLKNGEVNQKVHIISIFFSLEKLKNVFDLPELKDTFSFINGRKMGIKVPKGNLSSYY